MAAPHHSHRLPPAALLPLPHLTSAAFSHLRASLGSARVVMVGEATHGTDEFYRIRADLSRRLVEEDGFDFVAVEGDWPDCYRVNRYIHHRPPPLSGEKAKGDQSAEEALSDFERFPRWMWRNDVVRGLH